MTAARDIKTDGFFGIFQSIAQNTERRLNALRSGLRIIDVVDRNNIIQ